MKKINLIFIVVSLLLFSCGTTKEIEKDVTKYSDGYHALSDSLCEIDTTERCIDTEPIGFLPVLRPGETEMTKREFNKQFRQYKREVKNDRKDKRTNDKHDFIIDKKVVKQQGKTDRVETKQDGKTNRVEVKQTGKTDRVGTRRENSLFKTNFYPKILLLIVLITFVILLTYLIIKKFNK